MSITLQATHLPMASDCTQRHVTYIGSLSRSLGGTFRCSFIVAPADVIKVLERTALLTLGAGDAVMQQPEGGLALWVRFHDSINVDDLVAQALERGPGVRSGRQFSPFGHAENALRLGVASLDQDEIRTATARLAEAARVIGPPPCREVNAYAS